MSQRYVSSATRGRESRIGIGYAARFIGCASCAASVGVDAIGWAHSTRPCPHCGTAPWTGVVGTRVVVAVAT